MCFCFFWQLQWELDLDQIKNQCCPSLMENDYFLIGRGIIMWQVLWNTPFLPKCVNGPELGWKITLSSSMSDTSVKLSLWLLRYARTLWRWCQNVLHTVHIWCNQSSWAMNPVPYTSSPCCTPISLPQNLLSCTLENCNPANLLLSLRARHLCSFCLKQDCFQSLLNCFLTRDFKLQIVEIRTQSRSVISCCSPSNTPCSGIALYSAVYLLPLPWALL